jgi:hypothetical protein
MSMKKDHLLYDARKARIYKDMYRPSTSPLRFLGAIFSILLQGQSRIGGSETYGSYRRR